MIESAHQEVGAIIVEQLGRAQWHAFEPDSGWCTAVTTWPEAVSLALWAALLTDRAVQSVDLDQNRLVLVRPAVTA